MPVPRWRWLASIAAVVVCATGAAVCVAEQRRADRQRQQDAATLKTAVRILDAQNTYRRAHGRFAASIQELAEGRLIDSELASRPFEGHTYAIVPCGDGYVLEITPLVVRPGAPPSRAIPVGCGGAYPGSDFLIDPPPPGSRKDSQRS